MLDSTAGHEVVGVVRAVGAEVRAGPRQRENAFKPAPAATLHLCVALAGGQPAPRPACGCGLDARQLPPLPRLLARRGEPV
jgi:hypothetical protein